MLKFLKSKLIKLKKLEETIENNSDKIVISEENNIIKTDIKEEVMMNDFCIALDKSELIKDLFISIRILITKDRVRKI